MATMYSYQQVTDHGLTDRIGELVSAETSDGKVVNAVMERQWDGWNFTHVSCGFKICFCDLKARYGAIARFREMVSGKSSTAFKNAEKVAREYPDFVQPKIPTPISDE